ncbi:MAG: aldehyde dehydrogenase family protein [Planctomycetota bacterium]|jgi:aldehyde dehydrogenase (NAD+)|nr:aldehyde dehydrogenase family protein [Planctomycetota bacterium]MDP6762156.1 aldehyde dehydrogenase family protein [Planctomycetota bacterium]MDP6990935.1 aldehyde dehydrogenase family protein [Planctomycetota bacterium]
MDFLEELGIEAINRGAYCGEWLETGGALSESRNPATGELIAQVRQATAEDYERCIAAAVEAFGRWRTVPAPRRGEIVRRVGEAIRERKDALGRLITLEMGKIVQEGWGEVQEVIDITDFAVGQSRMLYGLSMHSERPGHAMREQWHPLGAVGVITAFNFPMAVWGWNAMLAWICGDACVWKPASTTPLCAVGLTNVVRGVLEEEGFGALATLVIGSGREVGQGMLTDSRLPLISFTGSTAVGRGVASTVAGRFGRTILELGGNNAVVVMEDADLDLALPAILFGAVGTAGQRCTSTRRVLVQASIAAEVEERLVRAYGGIRVGDPMDETTLCGPLIEPGAMDAMASAVARATEEGGVLLCGGGGAELEGELAGGNFVVPAVMRVENHYETVQEETFAPLLYVIPFDDLDDAIAKHNDVPQGLSSSMFTTDVRNAERFLSAVGSDCGIANVNIGTSGAEIGGAFGGEKETGGGRESGSDAWKGYMRRQTNTINYSDELPLAQGIQFG